MFAVGRITSRGLRQLVPRSKAARAFSTGSEGGSSVVPVILGGVLAGAAAGYMTATQMRADDGPKKEDLAELQQQVGELFIRDQQKTSSAFVFIKPHAVTDAAKALVRKELESQGLSILSEGPISSERIDKELLIDTHYGAIANRAVKQKPTELVVQAKAQAEFEKMFGVSWTDALSKGQVFNAMDGAAKLGISPDEMGNRYDKLEKGKTIIKFGGGFYCGKVDGIFVINGFYMNMRSKFTTPGTQIHFFEVQWNTAQLSWADFRNNVLGGTDPKTAVPTSVRHIIYKDWQKLGLPGMPNTGDNGVHASASPFEALSERSNWLGRSLQKDPFGRAMLASGVPLSTITAWCDDPAVPFEGKKQSLFDLLEDLDGGVVLSKSAKIAAGQ